MSMMVNPFAFGGAGGGLMDSAYVAADYGTAVGSSWKKILLDTGLVSDLGSFRPGTNDFLPAEAGYYLCHARVTLNITRLTAIAFGRNGTEYRGIGMDAGALIPGIAGSALFYCNGTTDTISLHGYMGGSPNVLGGSSLTWLSIHGPI